MRNVKKIYMVISKKTHNAICAYEKMMQYIEFDKV